MGQMKDNQIRIIGGKWRGRKLQVVEADGLRPTPDRIRETLFNWLAMDCPGAGALDCFAGSGALGLEALSRGAGQLTLIERNALAVKQLQAQLSLLKAENAEVYQGDAVELVSRLQRSYSLLFIDPPYARPELRARMVEQLESSGCLRDAARLYFEWPRGEQFELPSPRLSWLKQKSAGEVHYAIAEWRLSG
ncbi:MAG: 16S rRNA (guanine966-N2)-methyltransferase [Planctomycetota bacterium]|jgi:16S rRNA (guanine966-N2)-methyltransferase